MTPMQQRARVESTLAAIDPDLVARAPLLSSVLGLEIPDSELTASFDAKLRKTSLEDLLATVLRARADREPLVLVLEDCHWIDALSRDLLESLGRSAAALPVLFVLAYRPQATPGGGLGVERIPDFEELVLDRLDADDAAELIRSKLAQVLGAETPADISGDLVALVTRAGRGQRVLRRGARDLHRRSRDRRSGRDSHARPRAAGEPAHPRPVADRRAVRVAPPHR